MADVAETWRAALPLKVQAETTREGALWKPFKRDIPWKSIRVFDSKSAALSFLFLSRVMILYVWVLRVHIVLRRRSSRWVMAFLHSLHNLIPRPLNRHSFIPAVVIYHRREWYLRLIYKYDSLISVINLRFLLERTSSLTSVPSITGQFHPHNEPNRPPVLCSLPLPVICPDRLRRFARYYSASFEPGLPPSSLGPPSVLHQKR